MYITKEQIYLIGIAMAILITIIEFFSKRHSNKNEEKNIYIKNGLKFEKDIVFLNVIISTLCKDEIYKMEMQQVDFVNNNIFKEILTTIPPNIFMYLSQNYKDILYIYFSKSGLEDYIINRVKDIFMEYSKEKNKMI